MTQTEELKHQLSENWWCQLVWKMWDEIAMLRKENSELKEYSMDRTNLMFNVRTIVSGYGGTTIIASNNIENMISEICDFIEKSELRAPKNTAHNKRLKGSPVPQVHANGL